ncbi:hypothetical protein [Chryseobacterium candidae]|uniref:Lipoprotein n=2 Tax=Chryseobacterium TaxID=59732 RepID=A0ABY2RAA2_9FLAO|nr:hypothetical protein [Chryseobacterium candidae]THV61887.1 hypothetical protein EK417_08230 [Chryseobacterium candidae]
MMKNFLISLSLIFLSYSCEQKKEQKSITAINKTELNKTDSLISHNENESSTVVTDNNFKKNNIDFWKGEYYFEASNRDEAKTVFNITINSLEDISIDVTEEGTTNKYSKLNAEEVNHQKIKIKYDDSSDEMGIIYIEKSDDNYFISGNPIYFINPGNNEMPLQKLK